MSGWLTGRVVENRHWTENLFSLRVEGVPLRFQAGQFVRIALDIEGERVARAFSFVNPPDDPMLEFYGVIVPQGPLSPRLARLDAGDALHVASNPAGWLTTPVLAPEVARAVIRCNPAFVATYDPRNPFAAVALATMAPSSRKSTALTSAA